MHAQAVNPKDTLQQKRLITRSAFFLLFLLAPVLNIFRYDLTETRFILLGFPLSFNLNLDWVAQSTTPIFTFPPSAGCGAFGNRSSSSKRFGPSPR